ncbi:ADP-ribose pyrophosphatase YjhB (NUDIX family) [Neolewinella xylanilytica]|uniref:ADP-ribose pyrophosphatase YjhB (NUDIX family) n=1 Tax=Neolewinella xylanilytica TaxID=1514080 RepID=A0A2S6I382_9BACT|nr:NUDIX domain-containing protein [Neolewinella xylanilytica]PPK85529.1 ADP-ribose pyrophosphatase YjhB (NUDIX family) [Neolewinella xylanilytica]
MATFKVSLKARLILEDRGRILLLKQTKPNGGNYSLIGGTIERREYALESLIRESFEEAGVRLTPSDLSLVHVLHKRYKKRGKKHRIVLYFRAHHYEGEPESKELQKFENVEWHPYNSLPSNLTGTVRHVLKEYGRGKIYSEMEK